MNEGKLACTTWEGLRKEEQGEGTRGGTCGGGGSTGMMTQEEEQEEDVKLLEVRHWNALGSE